MKKAIFLDRDGVINLEKNYVHSIDDFTFIEGVFKACRVFQKYGYLLVVITNQSGIARGYYSENDFHVLSDWMLGQFEMNGIKISRVYYCPHHPVHGIGSYKIKCSCRKPKPGLLFKAKKDFNIDLAGSILVGDMESDIEAGLNAGIKLNCLIKSGHRFGWEDTKASIVVNNLNELESKIKPGMTISARL